MKSIEINFENEPIIICFKTLKIGLKIAQILQQANISFSDEYSSEQKYIQLISSFVAQQPTFVPLQASHIDERLQIQSDLMVRTITAATSSESVASYLSLSKMTAQQMQQMLTQQKQLNPQLYQTQADQQNIRQKTQQTNSQTNPEQMKQTIQSICIKLLTKQPMILQQVAHCANINLHAQDQSTHMQQIKQVVDTLTNQIVKLPTPEMMAIVQDFQYNTHIDINAKLKLIFGTQMNIQLPLAPPPKINIQPAIAKLEQAETSLDEQYANASKVLNSLDPCKVSVLIHSKGQPIPSKFNFGEEGLKTLICKEGDNLKEVCIEYIEELEEQAEQAKKNPTATKMLKQLTQTEAEYEEMINKHPINVFHQSFTSVENQALMVLVHKQLYKKGKTHWDELQQNIQNEIQLSVFKQITTVIEKNKYAQQKMANEQSKPSQPMPIQQQQSKQQQQQQQQPQQQVQQQQQQAPVLIKQEDEKITQKKAQASILNIQQHLQQQHKLLIEQTKRQALGDTRPVQPKPQPPQPKTRKAPQTPSVPPPPTADEIRFLLNSFDYQSLSKVILLISGLGTSLNLNVERTKKFMESNFNFIFQQTVFQQNEDRMTRAIQALIPPVLLVLAAKDTSNKDIQFKVYDQGLPGFDQFYEEYIMSVRRINAAGQGTEGKPRFYFTEQEIKGIIAQCDTRLQNDVVQHMAITDKKPEPEIKQKVGRNMFGMERSDTDSEDL
ncbi:Conserved_hypothetical protein [Hexamita inflata]|uniref:Uncharacterized protein n=1 Tax=Hexamita inflata TaxID=28002 RepID=A0AA86PWU7_9EUKA|nr:Conserved hypothetical protein [Hexamita inflata]